MKIDYNDIMKFKQEIEKLYPYLQNAHSKILKILEDAECLEDEKIDIFYSYIKEYESKLNILKADFLYLESETNKIESCLSQVKLLKKKRLTKIQSNMQIKKGNTFKKINLCDFEEDEDEDEGLFDIEDQPF